MSNKSRAIVAGLTLSLAGFLAIKSQEGYVATAMIPTQGDRPTIGYGSTFHEDGSPVRLGEKTTPQRAEVMLKSHVSKEEASFRKSLPGAKLTQGEFDLYMDFVYQYGTTNWHGSSMRKNILKGDYVNACNSLLQWKKAAGYDCSIPGNKRCWGVWQRQLDRHERCMGEQ